MGSLARHHRPAALALTLALGILAAGVEVAGATEIPARVDAKGLRIVGPEQVLSEYCSKDEDGTLWLKLPGGASFQLITSTDDPAIANPGDGAFHPYDEAEVHAALAGVRFPLEGLDARVLLLPYPRRSSLESAAGPGLILLSPGVVPMPAERQHAEFVHELGHVVQYQWMPDGDPRWSEYRVRRGIEDGATYSASAPHANRPHEIFAEDFRALFGGATANYSGSVENADLSHPAQVPGLDAFLLSLPEGGVAAIRIAPLTNPARGPVAFVAGYATEAPLDLFDVSGRRLATLEAAASGSGSRWSWDGRDASGRAVPRGMVLARVRDASGATARVSWMP